MGNTSSTTPLVEGGRGHKEELPWWMNGQMGKRREACSGSEAEEICLFYKTSSHSGAIIGLITYIYVS